jgi:multidrug efflux system outer membrane protein
MVTSASPAFAWDVLHNKPRPELIQAQTVDPTSQWATLTSSPFTALPLPATEAWPTSSFPQGAWWQRWPDADLQQIITTVLNDNLTLAQADVRVRQAQAVARQALGREFPTLTLDPAINRQKNSENLVAPNLGQATQGNRGGFVFSPGNTFTTYTLPLNARYEVDLFLKNRLITKGQQALAKAQQAQYHATLISLASTVSSTYLNWRLAQVEQALITQQLAIVSEQIALQTSLEQAGMANGLPLTQLEQQRWLLEQSLTQHQQQASVLQAQLATLLGQTPAQFIATQGQLAQPVWGEATPLFALADALPLPEVGLPSGLVLRRPDLLAQEAQLQAADINVAVARRAFLPTFSLSTGLNFASTSWSNWLSADSFAWSLGGSLAQTLLEGGQRWAKVKEEKLAYQGQILGYKQTLLEAFTEVETALTQVNGTRQTLNQLAQEQGAQQAQLALTQSRYQAGLTEVTPVLSQQLASLTLQQRQSEMVAQGLQARLSLIKALGGGW